MKGWKFNMKKVVAIILGIVICLSFAPTHVSTAANNNIHSFLESYFIDFYKTLEADSSKTFESNDFISTNGYIIAKSLVNKRETYNILLGGIKNVDVTEVILNDITNYTDRIEAMVYVKYSYFYGDCSKENQDSAGTLYRVTLQNQNGKYTVIDIDSNAIETQMVKDSLNVSKARNISGNFEAVDSYFDGQMDNAQSLLKPATYAEPIQEVEKQSITPFAAVSYDQSAARTYAYTLGDKYENYIFKRASLDCTNFVSQAVWAGYGGTSGYTIPTTPSASNSTCVALKGRVSSDYRMTSDWYGRNYDSPYGDPPSKFCGVVEFYNYTTSNTGNGPRATGYNNNSLYQNLSTAMQKGDVLQFYSSSAGRYYHSVMVVTETTYHVSTYYNVRVAQHQSEYNYRNLSELISSFGGDQCKMRLLRFNSTTF